MDTPLTNAVAGYVKFASPLLKEWKEHATGVASKLDAREYNADELAADLAKCTKLAMETGVGAVMAILAGTQCKGVPAKSRVYTTTLPGAALKLAGPMVSGPPPLGVDQLSPDHIDILPSAQLAAGATEFWLRTDATGHGGGTYRGTMVASKDGAQDEVIVLIPV
jgi:hypothetical protein